MIEKVPDATAEAYGPIYVSAISAAAILISFALVLMLITARFAPRIAGYLLRAYGHTTGKTIH